MKLILSFLLFFALELQAKCQLKEKSPLISLSGPASHVFFHLGILDQVQAISSYHGLPQFKGEVFQGGQFISQKLMAKYRNPIVFFDQSRELRRSLKRLKIKKMVEVKTRGLDSKEASLISLKQVLPYLQACETEIQKLEKKIIESSDLLSQVKFKQIPLVFFLGKVGSSKRLPNFLIVNDGPVKFLRKYSRLKTYPSGLAYLTWSEKVLKSIPDSFKVGLASGPPGSKVEVKHQKKIVNIVAPNLLIPGVSQLFSMLEWVPKLKRIADGV